MPDERAPDDLDEYLRGGSALSRQYQRESAPLPPHALDRTLLEASGATILKARPAFKSPSLAPLAFAASVFLSLAMVLAMVFGPQAKKNADDKPRVVQVRMFDGEPPRAAPASPRERNPAAWLGYIDSLRRDGRNNEAELEMRRFRSAYPDYIIPLNE
jgi:hypothetical protein